jgi:hypothetical protein
MRPTGIILDALKGAGLKTDVRTVWHWIPSDAAVVVFTPVVAGTPDYIRHYAQRQASNTFLNAIGAAAMFAITRNSSGSGAGTTLNAVQNVSGSGMLAAPNFKEQSSVDGADKTVAVESNAITYIATVDVGHTQSERSGESVLYLVVPHSLDGEILNGKPLITLSYGPTFSAVLGRAVIRAANVLPATAQQ